MERSIGDPMESIPVEKLTDLVLDEKTASTGRRAEEMRETRSGEETGAISTFTRSLSEYEEGDPSRREGANNS
jgi:hypothetical protein